MDKQKIENAARDLQLQIWCHRHELWPEQASSPFWVLDPAVAAHVLGIGYEHAYEFKSLASRREQDVIAGMIDRQARKIVVSDRFPEESVRFTGAHELGHWLLHPHEIMHRDRPLAGRSLDPARRPPLEREADYFAACFLMPARLVLDVFERAFSTKAPFVWSDGAAFRLAPDDHDFLLRAPAGSLTRAMALATAESYGGQRFHSLSKQFKVSPDTMAIRLIELEITD